MFQFSTIYYVIICFYIYNVCTYTHAHAHTYALSHNENITKTETPAMTTRRERIKREARAKIYEGPFKPV